MHGAIKPPPTCLPSDRLLLMRASAKIIFFSYFINTIFFVSTKPCPELVEGSTALS